MIKNCIWLLFSIFLIIESDKAFGATSPSSEAQEFINHLPEGVLTLDLVLAYGIKSSSSYQAAISGKLSTGADLLEARSVLNTNIEAEASYVDDRNEAKTTVSPSSTTNNVFKVKATKLFVSGTAIETEIGHGDGQIEFNNFPTSVFKETKAKVQLSQDLWRDFAGRGLRWNLKAAEKAEVAQSLEVEELTGDWMESFTSLFYSAWLGQMQVRAAEQAFSRKQRLLQITQLQLNRGTAELPDLYQVRRALRNAELAVADSEENIKKLWRQLIVLLKIYEVYPHWLKINPMEIPVKLDDPVESARKECVSHPQGKPFSEQAKAVQLKKANAESAELKLKAAKDLLRPDLKLAAGLVSNGVDPASRGQTFEETFSGDNPNWLVALTLKTSLEKDEGKARLQRASAFSQLASAEFDSAKTDFVLDWMNRCALLEHWYSKRQSYEKTLVEQRKRVGQEENRFQLGRVPLLNVITAADESTETELSMNQAEIEVRLAAWKVKRLNGELYQYEKKLRESGIQGVSAK